MLKIGKSKTHNKGLFTDGLVKKGNVFVDSFELNDDMSIKNQIEPTHYINHSVNNNLNCELDGNKIHLISNRNIRPNEELFINYLDLKKIGLKNDFLDFEKHKLFNEIKKDIPEMSRPVGFRYTLKKVKIKDVSNGDKFHSFSSDEKTVDEANEELDKLIEYSEKLKNTIIKFVGKGDLDSANRLSFKLKTINKSISDIEDYIDKKEILEKLKPSDSYGIIKAKENDEKEEIKEDIENKKTLDNLITDIKASNGSVIAKAKSKLRNVISSDNKILNPKNVVLFSIIAFSTIALVKIIK